MKKKRRLITGFLIATIIVLLPAWMAQAATITVTANNDVLDAAADCASVSVASLPGPNAQVSLREAICAANNNTGADTINFNIPGPGEHFIGLLSALPQLADDGTTIDGYTQPGASPATSTSPATIKISINGVGILNNGLNVTSSGNVIRGLGIYGFTLNGIWIANYGGGISNDNVIAGNYIGASGSGEFCLGNGLNGVFIGLGAQNNIIGGNLPADRNMISCNGYEGVGIHGSGTMGNIVSGNYIGIDLLGLTSQGNTTQGVRIYGGAQNNTIGGDTPGARNIISGNIGEGLRIVGAGTNGNIVSGNYIGTNTSGAAALPNGSQGVTIRDGAQNNLIGGDNASSGGSCSSECNLIAGNSSMGVLVLGSSNNTISGNYIGTDVTGLASVPNYRGIVIGTGSDNNVIGGDSTAERNLISGNVGDGVYIYEVTSMAAERSAAPTSINAQGNVISGNYIGTDVTGSEALPNSNNGITLGVEAQNNLIGGDTTGERNVISGNTEFGILLQYADSNVISGNYIGTDSTGMLKLLNGDVGVFVRHAQDNLIGGDAIGERNLISGNGDHGVRFTGSTTTGNVLSGNYIGLDASGTHGLGNFYHAILIDAGAYDNVIGGDTPGERNIISGSGNYGIAIFDPGTDDNQITGNYIGTDTSGNADIGNGGVGVIIYGGPQNNLIGPNNRIAFNSHGGILVSGVDSTGNVITQNSIYANELGGGIDLYDGGNNDMPSPNILTTSLGSVIIQGTALPGRIVEVFASPTDDGQGQIYLGSTVAEPVGSYTLELSSLSYPYLTATATDLADGTSEFSTVFKSTVYILNLPIVLK